MIKKWFNKLYGLDKNPDEDLEFVYSSYSNANETPSKVANLTFIFIISFYISNSLGGLCRSG